MGRKQKLKRERRAAAAKIKNNNNNEEPATELADTSTKAGSGKLGDHEFPKSNSAIEGEKLLIHIQREHFFDHQNQKAKVKIMNKFICGATKYGCVYSMKLIGWIRTRPELNETQLHLAHPWFLEGALCGSYKSANYLGALYAKARPHPPLALVSYWMNTIIGIAKFVKLLIGENTITRVNANN